MGTMIEILGTRVATTGVGDIQRRLLDLTDADVDRLAVMTAYFGPETFTLLQRLRSNGVYRAEVLLAANAVSRESWEAAMVFAERSRMWAQVRVARAAPGTVLHPKIIVVDGSDVRRVIVGSSNLTGGGMRSNVELNILLSEHVPTSSRSPVESVRDVFASFFAVAVEPDVLIWKALAASAPDRTSAERPLSASSPAAGVLAQLPIVGSTVPSSPEPRERRKSGRRTKPTTPSVNASTGGGYNSLLLQLSYADCHRPGWAPDGKGTAQFNLPRGAPERLNIPDGISGRVPFEAVGVGTLSGERCIVEAGWWPRPPRGPGRLPEVVRFTFYDEQRAFIRTDVGAPVEGDLFVLEVPVEGVWEGSPLRGAVIREDRARTLGLVPDVHTRGRPKDRDKLFWDVLPGSVL